jgi:hypothetical protein
MRNSLLAFVFALAATASFTSAAHAFDWSVCKAEIDKFCAGEKDDEKIWACLQKHDIDLSEKCDNEGHSKYEAATGKKK